MGGLLGDLPKRRGELQVKMIDELPIGSYTRRRLNYFVDSWERVTAWQFIPNEGKDELPAILCCHQQTPQGKDECAGIDGDPAMALAQRYAEMGYVTMACDCVAAGDRSPSNCEPYDTRNFYKDHPKMSALGKMLLDHMHAVDVLCESRRVDPARLGVVGHGLGGVNALMLAAFDERIQACVCSCAITRIAEDDDPRRWCRDEGLVLLPKLREYLEQDKELPFDWEHVLALAAPSPTLVLTALNDDELPNTRSCQKAVAAAAKVYKLLGAAGAIEHVAHREGRRITLELLEQADEWFERWL